MELAGWDVVHAMDLDLVNQALEAELDCQVTEFNHEEGRLRVSGHFGPWRILPIRLPDALLADIHVRAGSVRGLRRRPVDLTGLVLRAQLPIGLRPASDGESGVDLRFDPGTPAMVIKAWDPRLTLRPAEMPVVRAALSQGLIACMKRITYVFAKVARITPNPHWSIIEGANGSVHLAILGRSNKTRNDGRPAIPVGATAMSAVSAAWLAKAVSLPLSGTSFATAAHREAAGDADGQLVPNALFKTCPGLGGTVRARLSDVFESQARAVTWTSVRPFKADMVLIENGIASLDTRPV